LFDFGELVRQTIDSFTSVTAGRNRSIFGECRQNNLMCTTYRLTDGTLIYDSIMFLLLLWRSIPSAQLRKAPVPSSGIKISEDLDDEDFRRGGQLSRGL